jgi:YesN/AraC family two-component response regulator
VIGTTAALCLEEKRKEAAYNALVQTAGATDPAKKSLAVDMRINRNFRVEGIIRFVQEHYASKELSIETIAKHAYLSTNYLCNY